MKPGISTRLPRPALIVNARAGRLAGNPSLLNAVLGAVGQRAEVFVTRCAEDLDRAAEASFAPGRPVVVLWGGDGSYLAGVTALHHASRGRPLPPIAFARAGTVSIVARNWGSARNPFETLERLLASDRPARLTPRATLSVTEEAGPSRIGFTFGTGLVANFFDEYDRGGARGNGAALAIAGRIFVDVLRSGPLARRVLSPLPCRLSVDGSERPSRAYSLVLASVLRDVGLHHLVAYRAGEDPERPHLVASTLPPSGLVREWPRALLGRPLRGEDREDCLARRFDVEFPDGGGSYVLDGDTFRTRRVTVTAGPELRIAT